MSEKIQISFGDVFVSPGSTDSCVIVNLGKKDFFSASQLGETAENSIYLTLPGTLARKDIEEITGQMSLGEILAAAHLGSIRQSGKVLRPDMVDLLKKYSKAKPRWIE